MKIAPSILAADFANLAADVARVADDADLLHVDCMDGHYVPNLTIGPPVVKSLRKHTDLFLDCHLMVDNPGVLLAGVRRRRRRRLHRARRARRPAAAVRRDPRARHAASGSSLEPETPFDAVEPYLDEIDLLLVMSVHTGFGGQPFIPEVLDKVRAARRRDRRARPRRSRSRSTAASRSTTRRSRPTPASTSSCPAPASSAPTTPPPRHARSAPRGAERDDRSRPRC